MKIYARKLGIPSPALSVPLKGQEEIEHSLLQGLTDTMSRRKAQAFSAGDSKGSNFLLRKLSPASGLLVAPNRLASMPRTPRWIEIAALERVLAASSRVGKEPRLDLLPFLSASGCRLDVDSSGSVSVASPSVLASIGEVWTDASLLLT